jgi:hypothetical protein
MAEGSKKNKQGLFLLLLYGVALTVVIYFFVDAFAYYLTPFSERPHHTDYRILKPSGFRSHTFGIIGSTMLLLLLLYSLRKRTAALQQFGTLSAWLNVHIFLGVVGPLFIILHSTFKLNGLVAVSFWSMIAVAVSGIIGRYLYIQIPRSRDGHELSLADIKNEYQTLLQHISVQFNLDEQALAKIDFFQFFSLSPETARIPLILNMIAMDIFRPVTNMRLKYTLKHSLGIPAIKTKPLMQIMRQKMLIERRLHFLNAIHALFHYWHVFHKPFAIIMYLIMFIHLGISIWLGYTWIF